MLIVIMKIVLKNDIFILNKIYTTYINIALHYYIYIDYF